MNARRLFQSIRFATQPGELLINFGAPSLEHKRLVFGYKENPQMINPQIAQTDAD